MLSIIDRYILREVLKAFSVIFTTVVLIVAGMLFIRTLEEVNAGALGVDLVVRFTGLQVAKDTSGLLPPVFFIATLIALGRMSRDSELIAMEACGLGALRVFRSLLYTAIPIAIVAALFSLYLRPLVVKEIQEIRVRQEAQIYQIAGLKEGRFYQSEEGHVALYVDEVQRDGQLRNVFVHDRRDAVTKLITSQQGMLRRNEMNGEQYVTLIDGRRYDGVPGRADYTIIEFERYNLLVESGEAEEYRSFKRGTYETADLIGSQDLRDMAELQYRFSFPLAIFTFTLLAVPLTTKSPRERGSWRLFVGFLTYFGFFNLQRLAAHWFESGITPVWAGSLWYQPLILALVIFVLVPHGRWLKRLRRWPAAWSRA
jgi:lipopolysaccharide export system permease protein